MSRNESLRRCVLDFKKSAKPSLRRISESLKLRLPHSIILEQNSSFELWAGADFGRESKMFLTSLAASKIEILVPLKRAFADMISCFVMVLRIPLSSLKNEKSL